MIVWKERIFEIVVQVEFPAEKIYFSFVTLSRLCLTSSWLSMQWSLRVVFLGIKRMAHEVNPSLLCSFQD
jgi:hypothetical protein